jgi:hypothetical protein
LARAAARTGAKVIVTIVGQRFGTQAIDKLGTLH